MRIVSFLPAATEMAFALGLGDEVVGVSHECDYPPEAHRKPTVVRSAADFAAMAPGEIDRVVAATLREAGTLYAVDEPLLRALAPDVILTQDLCQVCAPSGNDVTRVIGSLANTPEIVYLTPRTLADIDENLRAIAAATGTRDRAESIIANASERLHRVDAAVARTARRPRVFFAEWTDPLYCAGHWVPEMIERAGGIPLLARPGGESVRVSREDAVASEPDIVIVAPCGYDVRAAIEQAPLVGVPAERIVAVDANAYFARPGPRLIDGIELLAHIFHPDHIEWNGASEAYRELYASTGTRM